MDTFHTFSDTEVARALYPWGLVADVAPRPFDLEACIARYRKGLPHRTSTDAHPWRDDFTKELSGKRGVVTNEEAAWWFVALTDPARLDADRGHFVTEDALRRPTDLESLDVRGAFEAWIRTYEERYRNTRLYGQAYLARLMLQLVGLAETVSILLRTLDVAWLSSFLDELYPSPGDDVSALKQTVRGWVAQSWVPPSMHPERRRLGIASSNARERLLPLARTPEEVRQAVDTVIAERTKLTSSVYHLVNAEPDDEHFLAHLAKLNPDFGRLEVVLVIGRLGLEGCDWLVERLRRTRRDPSEGLVRALAKIRSPRIVPALLDLAVHPITANSAREVLADADVPYAAGLAEVAVGRSSSRDLAAEFLGDLEKRDALVYLAAIETLPDDEATKIANRVAANVVERRPELDVDDWPTWMLDLACDERPRGFPRFCSQKNLRPIYLADGLHELPRHVVWGLLLALRDRDWRKKPHRILGANARVDLETSSLAAFVHGLHDEWMRAGFSSDQIWCLFALLEVLDDTTLLDFAASLEEWPTLGERQRAYDGLEVLQLYGSDVALAALNKLARTSRFRGLRTRASNALQKLATRRGVTPGQLEDMIIDDCGLEPNGTATFSYGSRTFELAFDAELNAVVRSSEGKLTKSLPRARVGDDTELVAMEKQRFKTIKKRVNDVIKLQRTRLDAALAEQRSWDLKTWRSQYVQHPVMTHLVRRLVWAETNGDRLGRLFRVSDTRESLDVTDQPIVPEFSKVCIAHPAWLDAAQLTDWGAVFADYEIVPPFPQLERPWYTPKSVSARPTETWDIGLPSGWLRGHFNRRGWSKSPPTNDVILSLYRDFHRAEVRVYAALRPGLSIDYKHDREQKIVDVWFVRRRGRSAAEPLAAQKVPAVVFSEAYLDLLSLIDAAQAREREHM